MTRDESYARRAWWREKADREGIASCRAGRHLMTPDNTGWRYGDRAAWAHCIACAADRRSKRGKASADRL